MNKKGAEIIEIAQIQMRLPLGLRTNHWYNDWQHAVFIITFDHLVKALRGGRNCVAERLIDKLTVYLYVHFLCEEEGMAWATGRGCLTGDKMKEHQGFHVRFLDYWHSAIQQPFRRGELTGRLLVHKIQDFYEKVLAHIDSEDQTTYGAQTTRQEADRMDEIAHIAASGLPLSPNMPGALAIVKACGAASFSLLRPPSLPIMAVEPMRHLTLASVEFGAGDSLRTRFIRAVSGQVSTAPSRSRCLAA